MYSIKPNTLQTNLPSPNITTCMKKCDESADCKSISFIILHTECFLFKKITTTLHQVGTQSIRKDCSTNKELHASKDSTPTWVWGLLAFIVIGIIGNVIYLVIKDRRRWKKEKMPKRESIDYNPDYFLFYLLSDP